jgi:hypothetical protein
MARHWNNNSGEKTVADDLEPYRRLVELQKQMIELAQLHEHSKRKRDALHEQMVREVVDRRRRRRGWQHHLQQSAAKLLQRVPGFAAEKPDPGTLNNNNHCHAESH